MSQSHVDTTKELQEELHQCKEKVASLEEENHKLDLQGNKVEGQYVPHVIDWYKFATTKGIIYS